MGEVEDSDLGHFFEVGTKLKTLSEIKSHIKVFHNRCHLRTHILSHLEVDGINSVSIGGPESLDISPLTQPELNIGKG